MIDNQYCDNILIINNREYYLEKVWRKNKTDRSRDSKGKLFPFPIEEISKLPEITDIISRLHILHSYLDGKKKIF